MGEAVLHMIHRYIDGRVTPGDRIGEAFCAIWMVVVSLGVLNSAMTITPDLLVTVIVTCFVVNLVWGIIDGGTVMVGNVIERADRDRLLADLRAASGQGEARQRARDALADTIAVGLGADETERLIDQIAAADADAGPPLTRHYGPEPGDWGYGLGIVAIDVLLVIPLVAPLILIHDAGRSIYVSRLIATLMFAALGSAYARSLNRNGRRSPPSGWERAGLRPVQRRLCGVVGSGRFPTPLPTVMSGLVPGIHATSRLSRSPPPHYDARQPMATKSLGTITMVMVAAVSGDLGQHLHPPDRAPRRVLDHLGRPMRSCSASSSASALISRARFSRSAEPAAAAMNRGCGGRDVRQADLGSSQ